MRNSKYRGCCNMKELMELIGTSSGRPSEPWNGKSLIILDEKYFRHITTYSGEHATHRTFVTDMVVAVARLDGRLAKALRNILI